MFVKVITLCALLALASTRAAATDAVVNLVRRCFGLGESHRIYPQYDQSVDLRDVYSANQALVRIREASDSGNLTPDALANAAIRVRDDLWAYLTNPIYVAMGVLHENRSRLPVGRRAEFDSVSLSFSVALELIAHFCHPPGVIPPTRCSFCSSGAPSIDLATNNFIARLEILRELLRDYHRFFGNSGLDREAEINLADVIVMLRILQNAASTLALHPYTAAELGPPADT
jgi:hypothetical protein